MQISTLLRICAALACTAVLSAAMAQSDPTVTVTGGQIRGRALQAGAVFKGIPFAAPPVGDLRWKASMPVKSWTGVRDAVEYGATCEQADLNWNKIARAKSSEDCLFVNVWTPEWPSKSKKAVMMWIHGGGHAGGSALGLGGIEPSFDGESLARHGVVVVTIQFRMGPLGFLAHPELTAESPNHASGNYGTMDQIAALKWIKENIAKFGGDPANVTIFGQSAGGHDVGELMVSPLSDGLFVRAIEESGTIVAPLRTQTFADAEKKGIAYAAKKGAPATGTIAYLRKLPVDELLKDTRDFAPGPNADGYVFKEVTYKTFAAGGEKKVPLLTGTNGHERSLNGGPEALEKAVKDFYGDQAPRAMELYSNPSTYPPYGDAGAQFVSDIQGRCPTIVAEDFHADAGNVVWAYEFTHPFPEAVARGSEHSGELRYVFGNFPAGDVTESERKISNDLQTYWTNYAKTGDPNGSGLPAWPKYDSKARQYLEFTDNGPVVKENLRGPICKFFEDYLLKEVISK